MNLIGESIVIKGSFIASPYSFFLMKLSSLLVDSELCSLYSSSLTSIIFTFSSFTESLFSVHELSVESLCLSSVLFEKYVSSINYLYPVGHFAKSGRRIGYWWVTIPVLYWFVIGSFLGGNIAGDIILLFYWDTYFWSDTNSCYRKN